MSGNEVVIHAGTIKPLHGRPNWRLPSAYRARAESLDVIEEVVSERFGLGPGGLRLPGRRPANVWPRWVAIYFMRQFSSASLEQIAERFDQNHGTVSHACHCIEFQRRVYKPMRLELGEIEAALMLRLGELRDASLAPAESAAAPFQAC